MGHVLTKEEIKERKEVIEDLKQSLLALSLLPESIMPHETLIIRIENDGVDTHDYFVKPLPEPENLW
jgi:hypothetical protein